MIWVIEFYVLKYKVIVMKKLEENVLFKCRILYIWIFRKGEMKKYYFFLRYEGICLLEYFIV